MIKLVCIAWILAMCCFGVSYTGFGSQIFHYAHSPIWWGVAACGLVAYYVLWYRGCFHANTLLSPLLKLMTCAAVFAVGWSYADRALDARLSQDVQHRQMLEGIVYIKSMSDGKMENWRQTAELLIPQQQRSIQVLLYPKKIYDQEHKIAGHTTDPLQLGNFYQVTLDLKPPHGYVNAGVFDQEKWLLQQNIQGTATVLYSQPLSADQIQQKGWYGFVNDQKNGLSHWRLWIEKQRFEYRQHLLVDQQPSVSKALLLGLLTGDRSGIDRDTTELYQMMGISHLLAISGPHVLILATMLTWLLMQSIHALMRRGYMRSLYQHVPKQYVYIPIFLALITFYVAFTGFEIPALRTWILAIVCSICLLLKLKISPFTALLSAAVLILWWDCFAILSAAFWLSFVASAILLLIYQQLTTEDESLELSIKDRIYYFFALLWQSQWRISLALLPVVLWQFQAVSLIAPVINMMAIPVISLVVPLDIIAALTWKVIPSLGDLIWWLAGAIIFALNIILHALQSIAERLYLPSFFDLLDLLCLSMAMLILMLPSGLLPRFWAIVFLLPLLPFFSKGVRPTLQLDVLDVGQGQSVLLRTAQHQMLIDTGAGAWQEGASSMGDRVVVPYLRRQGIRKLDEVLLSHLDADHSGGLPAVMQAIQVKQLRSNVYDPKITQYQDVPFLSCDQGQKWQWDQVELNILYPRHGQLRDDPNETSCVLLITSHSFGQPFKILIMGDLGWEGEYQLLQDYPDLNADILVLGHHGSRHSSAYDFLKQVNPKLAIISAGFDNRYGHPTPQTMARLHDLHIAAVNTAEVGAVQIELKNPQSVWRVKYARDTRRWLFPGALPSLRLNGTNQ